jgi:hypothetical protein
MRHRSKLVFVGLALLLLGIADPVAAGSVEDATAYGRKVRLAEAGNTLAQVALGDMYSLGAGVPQDYAEAAKWYRMAADRGNAAGQYSLGSLYLNGQGVPQDYVLAYMWFNLAATRSPIVWEWREFVARMMTPAQIAEAQKMAREWKPK